MAKEKLTHEEVAEGFWSMIPHDVSRTALEMQGIFASERQAEIVTRELLSLNLFWISVALHEFGRPNAQKVFALLRNKAAELFGSRFGYSQDEVKRYLTKWRPGVRSIQLHLRIKATRSRRFLTLYWYWAPEMRCD